MSTTSNIKKNKNQYRDSTFYNIDNVLEHTSATRNYLANRGKAESNTWNPTSNHMEQKLTEMEADNTYQCLQKECNFKGNKSEWLEHRKQKRHSTATVHSKSKNTIIGTK